VERGGVVAIAVRPDTDLDILIERDKEAQKALDGELAKLAAEHFGDIGLADTEEAGSLHLFEAAFFHEGVDLEY
jgi:hypothetical protein